MLSLYVFELLRLFECFIICSLVGRDPNLGRATFHETTGSRNNSNLHFKFTVLIKQNKCNHLLFDVLSCIQFCARKLPLSRVVLKFICK